MKVIAWDCAAIGRVRVVQNEALAIWVWWPCDRAVVGLTPCGGKVWRQKGDTRQRRCLALTTRLYYHWYTYKNVLPLCLFQPQSWLLMSISTSHWTAGFKAYKHESRHLIVPFTTPLLHPFHFLMFFVSWPSISQYRCKTRILEAQRRSIVSHDILMRIELCSWKILPRSVMTLNYQVRRWKLMPEEITVDNVGPPVVHWLYARNICR